jgi:hypothetical protein
MFFIEPTNLKSKFSQLHILKSTRVTNFELNLTFKLILREKQEKRMLTSNQEKQ